MNALYKGFVVSAIASVVILYPVTDHVIGFTTEYNVDGKNFNGMSLYFCGIIGLVITGLLIWITEYYTGTNYRPVRSVAASSTTGHGTNVIQGLAVSMEATAVPALIIVAGILGYQCNCGIIWYSNSGYYYACFSRNGCCT
jgi:K(+)-stimulated pyrophosphate-energized sodium pump